MREKVRESDCSQERKKEIERVKRRKRERDRVCEIEKL